MASPGSRPRTIRFGAFELDAANRELRKRGNVVKLQPQQFAVLLMLVEHAGQVVSREEIRDRVWDADTFVDFERSTNSQSTRFAERLRTTPRVRDSSRPFRSEAIGSSPQLRMSTGRTRVLLTVRFSSIAKLSRPRLESR